MSHYYESSRINHPNLGDDRRYWISKSTWIPSRFDFDRSILRTSEPQASCRPAKVSMTLIGPPMRSHFSEISISEEELFGEDTNLLGNVI